MKKKTIQALVLAAGKGTRMKSSLPKVLHEVLGRSLLECVLDRLREVGISGVKVVVGFRKDLVCALLEKNTGRQGISLVTQAEQKGTGHAVLVSEKAFRGFRGDILIWPGDMPFLKVSTLESFVREHQACRADASVLSALSLCPNGYGRIIRAGGRLIAIREELDASEQEKRIQEVNTGIYLFRKEQLFKALKKIKPVNAKQEYYLTDVIDVLSRDGFSVEAFPLALDAEARGVNSREQLSEGTQTMRKIEIKRHQEAGVTIVDPDTTYIETGVKIGEDSVVYPYSFIQTGVKIGKNCRIGPFAKINKDSTIGEGSVIGSFVEITRSHIGKGVLAKHLSYLGDAVVGDGTNIGAGTITANYDGKNKHKTQIGKKVFAGSNTVFVAPVKIEDGVKTGAGTVVKARMRTKKGQVLVGVPARMLGPKKK